MSRRGVPLLVLLFPLLAAVACGAERLTVDSESMEPTFRKGQSITVRSVDDGYRPKVGDVIVFRRPAGWGGDPEVLQVSRVIGPPGSAVACCEREQVTVNGEPLAEPYLAGRSASGNKFGVQVPAGQVWVMSDNRDVALDSRAHQDAPGRGAVPLSDVVGVVAP
ncbi:signal peptidase I [Nonomuraea rhizosphaerae]|uniref:signal peptidase I n=1 Tax=Nonomuraea rhizosphaerae TaxID=2665663 RepID=UPI001C5D3962|nr:signal peptidase I [Nonomuraea rhizosphaerae]